MIIIPPEGASGVLLQRPFWRQWTSPSISRTVSVLSLLVVCCVLQWLHQDGMTLKRFPHTFVGIPHSYLGGQTQRWGKEFIFIPSDMYYHLPKPLKFPSCRHVQRLLSVINIFTIMHSINSTSMVVLILHGQSLMKMCTFVLTFIDCLSPITPANVSPPSPIPDKWLMFYFLHVQISPHFIFMSSITLIGVTSRVLFHRLSNLISKRGRNICWTLTVYVVPLICRFRFTCIYTFS